MGCEGTLLATLAPNLSLVPQSSWNLPCASPPTPFFGEGAEQWHFVALYITGGARGMVG